MATINKITLPNGDSYDIEDKNAVTGVKGNAESSYRSGQVNLTAANIGAVATSGNETISGVKTFSAMPIANGISVVSTSPGTSGGLSLYADKTPTNYGIAMRNTSSTTKHGYVQGDWATYLYMAGAENRGWIFYGNGGLRASISNAGNAVFNGSVTLGGNSGNTAGCEMVFDDDTQSVLMSFH